MNRLALVTALYLLPVLIGGLLSCEPCGGGLTRFGIVEYKVNLRKLANSTQPYKEYTADTLLGNDTLTYKNLEVILVGRQLSVAALNNHASTGAAYACDPAMLPVDSIQRLTVTSDQAYKASLPAGSDLSSIISISGTYNYMQQPLGVFLTSSMRPAAPFYSLRFNTPPDRIALHRLTLNVDWGRGMTGRYLLRPVSVSP